MTATATIEEEVRQKHSDEIAAFVMPRPCRGQAVTWYPSGDRACVGEMAWVLDISKRNLVLNRASGLAMDTVRHVDDPKLKLSVEQRASGAWDFTEESKQHAANVKRLNTLEGTVAGLTERLKLLEDLLNEPAKKGKA